MDYQELFPVPVEWLQDVDRSMATTVAGWADAEVIAGRLEHNEDYAGLLLPAIRKLFIDIGLQSILFPEDSGGGGLDTPDAVMTLTAVLEQVGKADTGIGFLLANAFALQSAFAMGANKNGGLLEEIAPSACGDEVALCSLVLPLYSGSGSGDFYGLPYQVSAGKKGDGWSLTGKDVRPQCAGAAASFFGMLAEVEGGPGLFLVAADSGGCKAGKPLLKTGLAASINAELDLSGAAVPGSHLVCSGEEPVRGVLSWYYALCSAVCAGALLAVYDIVKEWGDTRVIKGKGQVFKENPLVAALMGEIGGKIQVSRTMTYALARCLSRPDLYGAAGLPANAALATTVFRQVTRGSMDAMDNAMELMGSAGYATEWNLERYWRDVKTVEVYVVPETVAQTDMARHYFDLKKL
jgi:alkylation response protein AidB-like acyl-CoA dehydrogenase